MTTLLPQGPVHAPLAQLHQYWVIWDWTQSETVLKEVLQPCIKSLFRSLWKLNIGKPPTTNTVGRVMDRKSQTWQKSLLCLEWSENVPSSASNSSSSFLIRMHYCVHSVHSFTDPYHHLHLLSLFQPHFSDLLSSPFPEGRQVENLGNCFPPPNFS